MHPMAIVHPIHATVAISHKSEGFRVNEQKIISIFGHNNKPLRTGDSNGNIVQSRVNVAGLRFFRKNYPHMGRDG